MKLSGPESWSIWCAFGLMLIAAVINARTLKVPNKLSFSAMSAGWLTAIAMNGSFGIPSQGGGISASLCAAFLGLLLVLPFYALGVLGGGCVKMQMAFGAWMGCAGDLASASRLVVAGTLAGGIVTAIAVGIAWKMRPSDGDGRPAMQMFPAQITLSVGSIIGVVIAIVLGWA